MTSDDDRIRAIRAFYGDTPKVSEWLVVQQAWIDRFGEATGDSDWLHTDPERAGRESPYGGTIAYGFWTIAMLTWFTRRTLGRDYPEGASYGLNYGFDRIRLTEVVRVGARIRNHCRLLDVQSRGNGRYLVRTENRIEIEEIQRPAMIAEWLVLLVYEGAAAGGSTGNS